MKKILYKTVTDFPNDRTRKIEISLIFREERELSLERSGIYVNASLRDLDSEGNLIFPKLHYALSAVLVKCNTVNTNNFNKAKEILEQNTDIITAQLREMVLNNQHRVLKLRPVEKEKKI